MEYKREAVVCTVVTDATCRFGALPTYMAGDSVAAAVAPPRVVALQSKHDGLCLQAKPLAFTPDCGSAALAFALAPSGRLTLASAKPAKGGSSSLYLSRVGLGSMVCADKWCVRCLSRGNSNRAHLSLCSLGGYEAVEATEAPRADSWSSPLLSFGSVGRSNGAAGAAIGLLTSAVPGADGFFAERPLLACLALCLLLLLSSRSMQQRRRTAVTAEARSEFRRSMELRELRMSLRHARDEARGPRLLRMMQTGGRFTELRPASAAHTAAFPTGKPVFLRLDPIRCEIDVHDASTAACATTSAAQAASAFSAAAAADVASPFAGIAPSPPPRAARPAGGPVSQGPSTSHAGVGRRAGEAVSSVAAVQLPYLYSIAPHTIMRMAFGGLYATKLPSASSRHDAAAYAAYAAAATPAPLAHTPWRCVSLDLAVAVAATDPLPLSIADAAPSAGPHTHPTHIPSPLASAKCAFSVSSGGGGPSSSAQAGLDGEGGLQDARTRLVFAAPTDEQAIAWFEGIQEVLHTLGLLSAPARPAMLLWARARLRLHQAAAARAATPLGTLARAVSLAFPTNPIRRRTVPPPAGHAVGEAAATAVAAVVQLLRLAIAWCLPWSQLSVNYNGAF